MDENLPVSPKWSAVGVELIRAARAAVGTLFEPTHIRRVARAEVDAALIKAEGHIAVSDLEQRAFERLAYEQARIQENIEAITARAIPHLRDEARPGDIAKDWLTHFYEKCRHSSDEEMQTLWGRILAGEANENGRFSRRTIDLVSTMERHDAEALVRVCRFCWTVGSDFQPVVFDASEHIYRSNGAGLDTLLHLQAIGVLVTSQPRDYATSMPRNALPEVRYFDTRFVLRPRWWSTKRRFAVPIGMAMFTDTGEQLAGLCSPQAVPDFVEYTLREWKRAGLLAKPIP